MDEILKKIDEEIEKLWEKDRGIGSDTVPIIVLGLERARDIVRLEQKYQDSWKSDAIEAKAKLGEIRMLLGGK